MVEHFVDVEGVLGSNPNISTPSIFYNYGSHGLIKQFISRTDDFRNYNQG